MVDLEEIGEAKQHVLAEPLPLLTGAIKFHRSADLQAIGFQCLLELDVEQVMINLILAVLQQALRYQDGSDLLSLDRLFTSLLQNGDQVAKVEGAANLRYCLSMHRLFAQILPLG